MTPKFHQKLRVSKEAPASETMRRIHFWLMVLWFVPGIPISIYLRYSVPWLVFLSVYAILATHWTGWSAERPTEIENGGIDED